MASVPYGLPVWPPHWIFTVNVWTYEIVGKYQVFTVIDNDNEAIPKPYFGHKGQKYVRQDDLVKHPFKQNDDGSPIMIGEKIPLKFRLKGYASTVVGTGPKGVGDKFGSYTEKSIGYDNLILEMG